MEGGKIFVGRKGTEDLIIFGRTSLHFAYQGTVVGRRLFYSPQKFPPSFISPNPKQLSYSLRGLFM